MANLPLHNVVVPEPSALKGNYAPALFSLATLYFMMGFITCLNDTLVPFFKTGFDLTYSQSSLVQFYFFLTYGLMSIPASTLVEKTGYKMGMVMGFVIAATGATLFYPASVYDEYGLFLAALFVIAIGIVLLQVAANPYITTLGSAQTASSRLALIQGVGSVGTTVAPIFGAGVILAGMENGSASSDALRLPYVLIGVALFLIALVVLCLDLPAIKTANAAGAGPDSRQGILAFRNLRLGMVALFAYVGAEVAVGTFLTNYIVDTVHIEAHQANHYVALYWGSMLAGRLVGAYLLTTIPSSKVLTVVAAIAMALIATSIVTTGYFAVWMMVLVGLCNSVMFAIIFSLSVEGLGHHTTRASGLLSSAIVGGAIVSYAQGYMKDLSSSWLQGCFLFKVIDLFWEFLSIQVHTD
jgi:MFS transporter, FHS family, L-fucose permease